MDKTKIWLLFSCDEWGCLDGARLVAATTDTARLNEIICNEIRKDNMAYESETLPAEQQVSAFVEDCKTNPHKAYVNLIYGFIECVNDGEVQ